jgi:hypothetical protein
LKGHDFTGCEKIHFGGKSLWLCNRARLQSCRKCRKISVGFSPYSGTRVAVARSQHGRVAFSSRKSHPQESTRGHVYSGSALGMLFAMFFRKQACFRNLFSPRHISSRPRSIFRTFPCLARSFLPNSSASYFKCDCPGIQAWFICRGRPGRHR